MKLVGIEEHYLTVDVREAWEAIGLAGTDPSVAAHSGEIARLLLDLAGDRLALMEETGLDVQVLSLTTPALHDLGRESVDLARRANDAVAQVTARWPDRFQALAALPIAMPEEAALELERCVRTSGFKGAMLFARSTGDPWSLGRGRVVPCRAFGRDGSRVGPGASDRELPAARSLGRHAYRRGISIRLVGLPIGALYL